MHTRPKSTPLRLPALALWLAWALSLVLWQGYAQVHGVVHAPGVHTLAAAATTRTRMRMPMRTACWPTCSTATAPAPTAVCSTLPATATPCPRSRHWRCPWC